MQDIVLDVQNLSHSYGGMPVWENVTFSVEAGQVALLAGPNGSGKTTLLKCVAGWIAPTSGTVSVSPGITPSYLEAARVQWPPPAHREGNDLPYKAT
jgi:ABC-type multidrug transport system ATPase subunit